MNIINLYDKLSFKISKNIIIVYVIDGVIILWNYKFLKEIVDIVE